MAADTSGAATPHNATVEVVVLRDPDASNSYQVFINGLAVAEQRDGAKADGVTVVTYDVDAGSSIEGQGPAAAREWADYHRASATELLSKAAAEAVAAIVDGYDDEDFVPEDDDDDDGEI